MSHESDGGESLLYLTDEQLRRGIEAMFFAYRGFTEGPDRILSQQGYGRAHHRALHFIHRNPGTTVSNLMSILGVTKQSLNRVLRSLSDDGLITLAQGTRDRRERLITLTHAGATLEEQLSHAQRDLMRRAYRSAGVEAVSGFRAVLEAMMDQEMRHHYNQSVDQGARNG